MVLGLGGMGLGLEFELGLGLGSTLLARLVQRMTMIELLLTQATPIDGN